MSKDTIYQFLKTNKGWFPTKEIAKAVGTNVSSTTRCLQGLRDEELIRFKDDPTTTFTKYIYRFKK